MPSKLQFVKEMFEFFESESIGYVMVGDYNFYINTLQGDIDLIVDPCLLPAIKNCFLLQDEELPRNFLI
jgi:hypothetical protein